MKGTNLDRTLGPVLAVDMFTGANVTLGFRHGSGQAWARKASKAKETEKF